MCHFGDAETGNIALYLIKFYRLNQTQTHTPLLQLAHELLSPRGLGELLLLTPPPFSQQSLRLGPGTLRNSIPNCKGRKADPGVDQGRFPLR